MYFLQVGSGTNQEETVAMIDVYREFNTKVVSKFNIKQYKAKKVTKSYAFGKPGIPNESEYLEVFYSVSFDFVHCHHYRIT